jgi:hypothetical protein
MWMDKLAAGVIRVITPIGPRFIQLSFFQRAYFLWIFRNFDTLPQQVLSPSQQRMIDALCVEKRFVSLPATFDDAPVIGTLERIPSLQVEEDPGKRPAGRIPDAGAVPLAVDGRHGS